MLPEQITAAIKKKAEEKYDKRFYDHSYEKLRQEQITAYTCGGEDAIGFMLKFTEWACGLYLRIENDDEGNQWKEKLLGRYYTTEQLLLKYMEETKL